MRIISHRSNLRGPNGVCDALSISRALSIGFDVEVDVRSSEGELWVGHDHPEFVADNFDQGIWFHAKDAAAVALVPSDNIVFVHSNDDFTIVSGGKRLVWLHPRLNVHLIDLIDDKKIDPDLTVILDVDGFDRPDIDLVLRLGFYGVCTDWPFEWKIRIKE